MLRNVDDSVIRARYEIVRRQVPLVAVAVCATMITEAIGFGGLTGSFVAMLMAGLVVGVCSVALLLWVRARGVTPDTARIARDMRVLSWLVIVGGCFGNLTVAFLIDIADQAGRFYLLIQVIMAAISITIISFPLGIAAYIYAGMSILNVIWCASTAGIAFPVPVIFAVTLYSIAAYTAMHHYLRNLDSAVTVREDLRSLSDQNLKLASIDPLTGLPNRRQFFTTLEALCQTADSPGRRVALGVLDLDRFKPVNDTYGHHVGDKVLAVIAQRLTTTLSAAASLFRLGGDEFAFILDGAIDDAELVGVGKLLVEAVERPIAIDDIDIALGCSIGLSVGPDMSRDADILFEYADAALYAAKRAGRGHITQFSHAMLNDILERNHLEQLLRDADQEAEFYPVFQPIVSAKTGETQAFECLARWESPTAGAVSPGKFVPAAERIGLITPITLVLLRKAIAEMRTWPPGIRLSFNLSVHDVMNAAAVERILGKLRASGLAMERFSFEITETALLQDFSTARANIAKLRESGASVALDDFGTGYSSLSHVQSLPLDKLKIDRRFVQDIHADATNQMIVGSLLGLCRGLGIGCVAEGAETEAEVRALQALGCEEIQGYYFARPIPGDAVLGYLLAEGAAQRRSA